MNKHKGMKKHARADKKVDKHALKKTAEAKAGQHMMKFAGVKTAISSTSSVCTWPPKDSYYSP